MAEVHACPVHGLCGNHVREGGGKGARIHTARDANTAHRRMHVRVRMLAYALSPLTTPSTASAPPPHPHTSAVWNVCRTQCGARRAVWGACAEKRMGQRGAHTLCESMRWNNTLAPSRLFPHFLCYKPSRQIWHQSPRGGRGMGCHLTSAQVHHSLSRAHRSLDTRKLLCSAIIALRSSFPMNLPSTETAQLPAPI